MSCAVETGLPFTSVTGLQLMFFPALAFVLVLQSLLLAYSIEFFVSEMSSTFSAVGGVILLILNCLLGTLLLFWVCLLSSEAIFMSLTHKTNFATTRSGVIFG